MLDASFLVALLAMLLLGKILGDFVNRLGFTPLIGQMVAGIVLGPMCLNLVQLTNEMDLLANIGILFMMFLMGLSIDLEKVMRESVYKAVFISVLGGTFTFLVTTVITALLGFSINESVLVGISFVSTSTAIGFMVLTSFGDRQSKVFKTIMVVGITDDIFAIIGLALFTSYLYTGIDVRSAFSLFLLVLGFIIFVLAFGRSITDRLIDYSKHSQDEQPIIAISLILLFFVSYLSQSIGIASVTGAFLAGTILARSPLSYKVIMPKIEAVSEGMFIPLFFVYTGVRINIFNVLSSKTIDLMIASIPLDVVLFLGLVMAVMVSKYFGTYIAGKLIGEYKEKELVKISLAMVPMGEYTLVIGQLGLTMLIINTQIFSVLALVVLFLSVTTPVMLRTAYES